MISIIKNKEEVDGLELPFSYYKDNLSLITKQGYLIEKDELYWNDDPILVEIESLYTERFNDLPSDIGFFMDQPIKESLFSICGFKCHKGKLKLELCSYQHFVSWETSIYNPIKIIEKLKEVSYPDFEYWEPVDDNYNIFFYYEKAKEHYLTIEDFVEDALSKFKKAEQAVRTGLSGFRWKTDYQNSEILYSKEVIMPLLLKMGFLNISYSHGNREFGKDFVFSATDKFGNFIHYGMQVKAGDINGKVNGQIDQLIGQIDDAFKIPFRLKTEQLQCISYLYIVISGNFTENAIEKILYKIPAKYNEYVKMLDKESVIQLLGVYGY
ncbi:hypothetical protein IWX76_000374 [Pedobacter sp. CAN_A7]|uniref:hypothetical protein n=1 Tax=Pedobacter sp. CAN_A7 TaxID=2787722 RepID=UPI0018CAA34A